METFIFLNSCRLLLRVRGWAIYYYIYRCPISDIPYFRPLHILTYSIVRLSYIANISLIQRFISLPCFRLICFPSSLFFFSIPSFSFNLNFRHIFFYFVSPFPFLCFFSLSILHSTFLHTISLNFSTNSLSYISLHSVIFLRSVADTKVLISNKCASICV